MLRTAAAALLLLFSTASLQAQFTVTSDLSVRAESQTAVLTGGRLALTVTATNAGPDAADAANVHLSSSQLIFTSVTAPGWQCGLPWDSVIVCSKNSMGVGSQTLRFEALVTNRVEPGVVPLTVYGAVNDPKPEDNRFDHTFTITAAPATADLSVIGSSEAVPFTGGRIPVSIPVHNAGPDATGRVHLFSLWSQTRSVADVSSGWSCEIANQKIHCSTPSIPGRTTSTLRYTIDPSPTPTQVHQGVSVVAEGIHDPNLQNNAAQVVVTAGVENDFGRVLLPVATPTIQGAFGSQWKTESSLFSDSEADVAVFPEYFVCPILCPGEPPFGRFVPRRTTYVPSLDLRPGEPNPGYLLYFEERYADVLSFQLRVRDLSRQSETWGTEIPVVRESELLSRRAQLLDVPVRQDFRQLLRIYDPYARPGSKVRVRLYVSETETLLVERDVELQAPTANNSTSPLQLPVRPGYAQLMLGDILPDQAGPDTIRVEIEPLTAGLRFWAFVTVTHNATQHVTVVTPQ
jgi:hypothetical protein